MRRIEEEQSFEELKILRELVHERFHKQEELAEVRDPVRRGVQSQLSLSASVLLCLCFCGVQGVVTGTCNLSRL